MLELHLPRVDAEGQGFVGATCDLTHARIEGHDAGSDGDHLGDVQWVQTADEVRVEGGVSRRRRLERHGSVDKKAGERGRGATSGRG